MGLGPPCPDSQNPGTVLSPLPTARQASTVGLFPSPQALVQGAAQQGSLSLDDLSRDENGSPHAGQNRTALPVGGWPGEQRPRQLAGRAGTELLFRLAAGGPWAASCLLPSGLTR